MVEEGRMIHWPELHYIGDGFDSRVFRKGNQVVKKYNTRIPISVVRGYQDLTNAAATLLRENPYCTKGLESVDKEDRFQADYQVNPIDLVEVGQGKTSIATSAYVSGPHILSMYLYAPIWKRNTVDLEAREQQALERIRIDILEARFSPELDGLEEYLISSTGVSGISIKRVNDKIRYNFDSRKLIFIVTDLASSLRLIKDLW